MEYELKLIPFERKDGFKYKLIDLTDFALHTTKCDQSASLGKKIEQSFEYKKPGRIYGSFQPGLSPSGNIYSILENLRKDPDFNKFVLDEEKKGCKILVGFPKEGIPIYPGKDTQEFLNSKNGRRIIRGLAKNKDMDI